MDHPECDVITYEEYQKIKSKLLADAKALCKAKSYWAVCVAIKTVRNMYVVNKNTGYLFVANSDTEYYHKLEDWNFDGALVITVYLHEIDATTFTKYPSSYVKASSDITYPWVTVEFHGEIKAYGSLKDDASLIKNIMEAMRRDDAFAKAMSDMYNPEYTTMEWDYSTYEEIAIGIVDFCKADYREWAALKSRGREDGDWAVISEDESIVIS